VAAPPRPTRPLANPNLLKTSSASPDRRKVSFQEGPPEQIESFSDHPDTIKRESSAGGKLSKWQPLSSVDPSPVVEHDPFSLGDSEDEKDARHRDPNADEAERALKATGEAEAANSVLGSKNGNKSGEER
jgi:hypothetical protein